MNTTLYINPLTPEIHFLIFDWENTITETLVKGIDTGSTFPKILIALVDKYDISDIWCVTGPGAFTLMRVVTLAINWLIYTRPIQVKSCHFFDLIGNTHLPIIEANSREYLIREGNEIISVTKWDLIEWVYEGIFSDIDSTLWTKSIQYSENRNNITRVFSDKSYEERISPLYFKPPNITCPKL